jgi:hypothetical protein
MHLKKSSIPSDDLIRSHVTFSEEKVVIVRVGCTVCVQPSERTDRCWGALALHRIIQ